MYPSEEVLDAWVRELRDRSTQELHAFNRRNFIFHKQQVSPSCANLSLCRDTEVQRAHSHIRWMISLLTRKQTFGRNVRAGNFKILRILLCAIPGRIHDHIKLLDRGCQVRAESTGRKGKRVNG